MKKILLIGLGVFLFIAFIGSFLGNNKKESQGQVFEFEEVGYFQSKDKLRYYTFWIKSNKAILHDSIPLLLLEEVKTHGGNRMHTDGKVTVSFYYLDRDKTPDISALDAAKAKEVADYYKPAFVVWQMPNGQVNFFNNMDIEKVKENPK